MYENTIQAAVEKVNALEWENGMATNPVTVKRECSYIKVIRKCGNLDHPEIILFKIIPKNDMDPDFDAIAKNIKESMGLYGDICIDILGDPNSGSYTAVIGNE